MASNASVVSARTSLSSILKTYSPLERDKVKNSILNKVRFELPKNKGILEAIKEVDENQNYTLMNEFVSFLRENSIEDTELLKIITDAHTTISKLSPKFASLVEALMDKLCLNRSAELLEVFNKFYIDIIVAHNRYLSYGVTKLIQMWIPPNESNNDKDDISIINDIHFETWKHKCLMVHDILEKILNAIPLAFNAILEAIERQFPYFKRSTHLILGYIYNVMKFLEYKPIFTESVMQIIMNKLVLMDVNASRNEIEDYEMENDGGTNYDCEENGDEQIDKDGKDGTPPFMIHPVAKTLDFCLLEMYRFFNMKSSSGQGSDKLDKMGQINGLKFFKILIKTFDTVILPIHNTHHVQFLIFYYSSLKMSYTEMFLCSLWEKIKNPNTSAVIRQAAVSYVASFLARSKLISLNILKQNLSELCNWCHQYIKNSDQHYRFNNSLKANLVFYAMCQAIFYVIAFRSRDLTKDKKSLLFLQSLQLPALVTCNFNPLRVCLPAVATAFAGVTRTYQLAYCHAILERNARRKLAAIYAHETATPEETMDTFFPFDPYILKLSSQLIKPLYMEYKASEGEEFSINHHYSENDHITLETCRKRCLSENQDDHNDIDDFLLPMESKRQKHTNDIITTKSCS